MPYTHISQVPKRRQWEGNSAPNQPYNCGPTSVAFIADFYKDKVHGIEATRDLAHLANGDGTSGPEQALMLTKLGVPATVQRPTMAQLTDLVKDGNRPVVIGMMMSIIPAAIRGHSFGGLHAVVVRQNVVGTGAYAGQPGKLIMDPNFDYGMTADPFNGSRFYPDSVIQAARTFELGLRSAVVPTSPKVGAGGGSNLPIIEGLQGLPDGASVQIVPGKQYQFFWFDPVTGARSSYAHTYPSASGAPTEGIVDLTGEGPAYFLPSCYVGNVGGQKKNVYLPTGYVDTSKGELYIPPAGGGFTQKDLDEAKKKGAEENEQKWEDWNKSSQATKP